MLSSARLASLNDFVERRNIFLCCHNFYAPTRLANPYYYLHMADR